ncbi:hypothetical protein TVAG_359850 [Trichomonas vaginalis G3]|uniref:Protein kinase domain-containing protein n=1 Tax=Trichomonas vaginalis (strain ATCC PRA-98 / G3) TaxID=412133 RepID=A2DTA4_TRIV3|nr:SEL-1-like protein family [Trichomonas vaginalis G3]EAY16376.1 hypothetical protein TVAG_359850 [Trichomonas vaginalis G3]KAI5488396.1 SEL-1-like protein family [Trichomonas vaginalis G3]|eukprot:XP_001328599.1 hypothetical protein [Trichomonas vaginalis G3]
MKPKKTDKVGVIKDLKTNYFYVIKLIDTNFENDERRQQLFSLVDVYNQIKFACLPEIIIKFDPKANQIHTLTRYYHHGSLQNLIDANQIDQLTLEEKMEIIFSVTAATHALHANNIIHSNIKPTNILFDHSNTPILCDINFIAQLNTENTIQSGVSMHDDILSLQKIYKILLKNSEVYKTISVNNFIESCCNEEITTFQILENMIQNNFFMETVNNTFIEKLFNNLYPSFIGIDTNISIDISDTIIDHNNPEICLAYASKFWSEISNSHSFSKSIELLNESSNNPFSAFNLAKIYLSGSVEKLNIEKSFDLLKYASNQGLKQADLELAKLLLRGYQNNTVGSILNLLSSAADADIPEANFILSQIYEKGISVEKNSEMAMKYLRLSANQGNIDAMFRYGTMLREGHGIAQNLQEAAQIFQDAAERGDVQAKNKFGLFLRNGIGVKRDYIKAASLFKQAADQNYAEAQNNYGVMIKLGEGVPKNSKISAKFVEKAANQGCPAAQNNYGWMLKVGYGVEKSLPKSSLFFKLSSEGGSKYGQNNYGLALLFGYGIKKNEKLAVQYFHDSAKQGDKYGCLNYGLCLYEGIGCLQNEIEGMKYIRKSADLGVVNAMFLFANICKDGIGVENDYKLACQYYKKAADIGHEDAKFCYGLLLKKGKGCEKSDAEADKYLSIDITDDSRYFHIEKRKSNKLEMARESDIFSSFISDNGCCGLDLDVEECLNEFNLSIETEKYIKEAADKGNSDAQLEMAKITKDDKEKENYLEKAAKNGNTEAKIACDILNTAKKQRVKKIRRIKTKVPLSKLNFNSKSNGDLDFTDLLNQEKLDDAKNHQFFDYEYFYEEEDYDVINDNDVDSLMNGSELGLPEANYQLGLLYKKGEKVEKDEQKADEEFKKAADKGHVDAMHKHAKILLENENESEAEKYFLKAAENGNEKSAIELSKIANDDATKEKSADIIKDMCTRCNNAELYYRYAVILRDGIGIQIDLQKSSHYFLLAAKMEYLDSGYQHGLLIINENKIKFSMEESKNFILEAMSKYQTDFSVYLLGLCLLTGIGFTKDKSHAISLLNQSQRLSAKEIVTFYNNKDKKCYERAVEYLAEAGCIEAMNKLALQKKENQEINDYVDLVKTAADFDNPQSQFEYGTCLFEGRGIEQNIRQGKNLIEKAAVAGNPDAQFYIAKELEKGDKIEQDLEKAAEYYGEAAENDHSGALCRLAMININETAPNSDKSQGYEMLKAAAEAGNPEAVEIFKEIDDEDVILPDLTTNNNSNLSDNEFPEVASGINVLDLVSQKMSDTTPLVQREKLIWKKSKPSQEVEILSFGSDDEQSTSPVGSPKGFIKPSISYGSIANKIKLIQEKMNTVEQKQDEQSKIVENEEIEEDQNSQFAKQEKSKEMNQNPSIISQSDSGLPENPQIEEKLDQIITTKEYIADDTHVIVHSTSIPSPSKQNENLITVIEDEIDLDTASKGKEPDVDPYFVGKIDIEEKSDADDKKLLDENQVLELDLKTDSDSPKGSTNSPSVNLLDENQVQPLDLKLKSDSYDSLAVKIGTSGLNEEESAELSYLGEKDVENPEEDFNYLQEKDVLPISSQRKALTPSPKHSQTKEHHFHTPHNKFNRKFSIFSPTNRFYEQKRPSNIEIPMEQPESSSSFAFTPSPISKSDSVKFSPEVTTKAKSPKFTTPTNSPNSTLKVLSDDILVSENSFASDSPTKSPKEPEILDIGDTKKHHHRHRSSKSESNSVKSPSILKSPKRSVASTKSDISPKKVSIQTSFDSESTFDSEEIKYSPKNLSPKISSLGKEDDSSSKKRKKHHKKTNSLLEIAGKEKDLSPQAQRIIDGMKKSRFIITPEIDLEEIERTSQKDDDNFIDDPYSNQTANEFIDSISVASKRLASEGDSDEQLKYALYLLGTCSTEENQPDKYEEAMKNLEKSSKSQNPSDVFLYNQFRDRKSKSDTQRLMSDTCLHFKRLAEQGDASAMYVYALMLRSGFGVKQDLPLSVTWFKAAGKRGHAGGNYNAGLMIRHGIGHPSNPSHAAYYYKQAADAKYAKAAFNLGLLYLKGQGVTKSNENAAVYFKIAADKGDSASQANYGLMLKNGYGVHKDIERAQKYFELSAKQNDPVGLNNLGLVLMEKGDKENATLLFKKSADLGNIKAMYNYGLSRINDDPMESARYFQMSAEKGNSDSQLKLGMMLRSGDVLPQDLITALHYIVLSAKQGNVNAMCVLGRMLKQGEGTTKNPTLAAKYFLFAAKHGNNIAMLNYGLMLKDGTGVDQNIEESVKFIKMSADSGNAEAQCYYATMLSNGKNIEKNREMAINYFKLAAQQDFSPAKKCLERLQKPKRKH